MGRSGVAIGALVMVLAGTTAGVASAAEAAGTAPSGTFPTDWVVFELRTGPVKGIVLVEAGAPGRVRYSLQGLPASGEVRLVGSKRPCAQGHVSSAKVLGWSLGASNPTGIAAGRFALDIDGASAGYLSSIRVFRGAGLSDQRACAAAVPWQLQHTSAAEAYELKNVMVSSFLGAPSPSGLILTGTLTDDRVALRASLLGLRGGTTYRLVGSSAPCGTAHTALERVYTRTFTTLGDTGTHEIGHWVSVVLDPDQKTDELRSVRLFRGTGHQVECKGIIAILIGL